MTVRQKVKNALVKVLAEMNLPFPERVIIEEPKNSEHGDLSTNAAMLLSKKAGLSPHTLAEKIAEGLKAACPEISHVAIAGKGFCNIFFKPEAWKEIITRIEVEGGAFGRSRAGEGKRALVEYVSANPTGPLHIGHGRGAAVGDSVARILREAGYSVGTEYYLNDAGRQMRLLGESVWARAMEAAGESADFPEDGYKGEYIRDIAREVLARYPDLVRLEVEKAKNVCQEYAVEQILSGIREDLTRFRCEHQSFFSEKSLLENGAVERVFNNLKQSGRSFEKDGAVWFDSVSLGDEKNRVLRKSDGSLTYFATDIAYHHDKFDRGYEWLIDVWGADHHGYIPRMKAAVSEMGQDPEKLDILLIQLVNLMENGELLPMSTRGGEFVTLSQLMDEVGVDAARFLFLSRSSDAQLDFDLNVARSRSMDNPVYYVQYAHARVCSLLRRAEERGITIPAHTDVKILANLKQDEEIAILRLLDQYEETVAKAAKALAPQQISRYLTDLAGRLHAYYAHCNIISQNDVPLTLARLALVRAAGQTLRNGLHLLGVTAPEAM